MRSFLSDALIDASDKKRTHASSRLSEPLQTLYQTHYSNFLKKNFGNITYRVGYFVRRPKMK